MSQLKDLLLSLTKEDFYNKEQEKIVKKIVGSLDEKEIKEIIVEQLLLLEQNKNDFLKILAHVKAKGVTGVLNKIEETKERTLNEKDVEIIVKRILKEENYSKRTLEIQDSLPYQETVYLQEVKEENLTSVNGRKKPSNKLRNL